MFCLSLSKYLFRGLALSSIKRGHFVIEYGFTACLTQTTTIETETYSIIPSPHRTVNIGNRPFTSFFKETPVFLFGIVPILEKFTSIKVGTAPAIIMHRYLTKIHCRTAF